MPEHNSKFHCPACHEPFVVWQIEDDNVECPNCHVKFLVGWEGVYRDHRMVDKNYSIVRPIEPVPDNLVKPNGDFEIEPDASRYERHFAEEVLYHGWCRCAQPNSLLSDVNFCHCGGLVPCWPAGVTEAQKQAWRERKIGLQPPTPERLQKS